MLASPSRTTVGSACGVYTRNCRTALSPKHNASVTAPEAWNIEWRKATSCLSMAAKRGVISINHLSMQTSPSPITDAATSKCLARSSGMGTYDTVISAHAISQDGMHCSGPLCYTSVEVTVFVLTALLTMLVCKLALHSSATDLETTLGLCSCCCKLQWALSSATMANDPRPLVC